MRIIKDKIKKIINKLGWELHKFEADQSFIKQLLVVMENNNINIILDIGANIGQFSSEIRGGGFDKIIVSFEPLSSAHRKLLSRSKLDSNWIVHDRVAIGDINGETEINISSNSVSSSLLPMLNNHSDAALNSVYHNKEFVQINRLDSIASKYIDSESIILLKIDTQGFEWKVLDGAENIVLKTKIIVCELSLIPLYEGQHLWLDIIKRLEMLGFKLWALQSGFTNKKTGQTLQIDAIFIR